MIVTARFIGSLVSLGFVPGQQYTLQVIEGAYANGCCLQIRHVDYPYQVVPYSRWATFLDNWAELSKGSAAIQSRH